MIKRNRDEILKIIEELDSGQDSSVRNSNKKDREIKIKSYKEILVREKIVLRKDLVKLFLIHI